MLFIIGLSSFRWILRDFHKSSIFHRLRYSDFCSHEVQCKSWNLSPTDNLDLNLYLVKWRNAVNFCNFFVAQFFYICCQTKFCLAFQITKPNHPISFVEKLDFNVFLVRTKKSVLSWLSWSKKSRLVKPRSILLIQFFGIIVVTSFRNWASFLWPKWMR